MRVISYILAFYMLFLAIEPGLSSILSSNQEATDCCSTTCKPGETDETENEAKEGEQDENSVCNPFQFCKCCLGFNAEFACQQVDPLRPSSKLSLTIGEKVPPQITVDFWQPPKLS